MDNGFYIGIDLHGTLLNRKEKVEEIFHKPLEDTLKKIKPFAKIFICTGNDLPFVKEVVPEKIFSLLDGCVLETGCVVSEGDKEIVKTSEKMQRLSQELRIELENKKFPEVTEFRRRLTTVSLFCNRPADFFKKIDNFVKNSEYGKYFSTTYSSVAVDVIPKGFDKFVGMKIVAGSGKIIGIADSMNDFELIEKSDFSFVPANCSEQVIDRLKENGKGVKNILGAGFPIKNTVIKSNFPETEGVIEILEFIFNNISQF